MVPSRQVVADSMMTLRLNAELCRLDILSRGASIFQKSAGLGGFLGIPDGLGKTGGRSTCPSHGLLAGPWRAAAVYNTLYLWRCAFSIGLFGAGRSIMIILQEQLCEATKV